MVQTGSKIDVTVSGIKIDNVFPKYKYEYSSTPIPENIAYISSANLTFIVPYYNLKVKNANGNESHAITKLLGSGSFTTTIREGSVEAVSASGEAVEPPQDTADGKPGVSNQAVTKDDSKS